MKHTKSLAKKKKWKYTKNCNSPFEMKEMSGKELKAKNI
jgi:hypothetical protein